MIAFVALWACDGESICESLHNAARGCDLAPPTDQCDGGFGKQLALLREIRDDGCDALYGADDRVRDDVCSIFGWDCPGRLYPRTPALTPLQPVVLVSGIDDSPLFDWNQDLVEVLGEDLDVHHVVLPAWDVTSVRARALAEALEGLPPGPLHLVCWAVGGLDCRMLASPGGLYADDPLAYAAIRERVLTVTTLSTPHRGTNVADVLLDLPPGEWREIVASGVLGSAASLGASERDERLEAVLRGLTLDGLRAFDLRVVDAPGVLYRSWAGVSYPFDQTVYPSDDDVALACRTPDGAVAYRHRPRTHDAMSEALWATAAFAEVAPGPTGALGTGPSDGMIAVESARWGTFQGCVPADHYDLVGGTQHFGVDPITGFDAHGFVLHVASGLAEVEP